jgi:hypothetical protein
VELRSNSRGVLLRLRLYTRLNWRKDPDSSGVHTNQASGSGDGDARHA